ncbi:cubilin-like [Lingula anatina]|uniref:Cubilin-like n=1 Tax=Lingula anatina TaxID=7574 RepID=A0A1S3HT63_LINAN|nr:cubilin-like [Lingula anatina]|eukprot:XP_013388746.1 cubilin-like [Lingula anatina]
MAMVSLLPGKLVLDYSSSGNWVSLGRYCHNEAPAQHKSTGTKLRVKFRSDPWTNGNGFSANWTSGCGALFTQDTGIILSPGFPGNYENNLTCNYTIMVDPQKFVLLTFDEENFNIEGGTGCPYDYVAAYTGNGSDSNLLGKFCGRTAPAPVSSLGVMFIQFVTDSSIVARGYRATYSAMECGGVYTAPQGTIRTPQHPVNYHHNANCTWSITVQPDRVVELKFNIFDIETHSSCNYDYVDVRDGNSLTSPLIGRFCSNVIPEPVRTTGNTMTVNFVSDASINGAGFTASYRTTFGVPLCGGFLNGTQGRFGSFDIDGDGLYEDNLNCVWQIVGQDNKVLNLTFEPMDIEADNTCDYDYLEVRDGLTSDDPLVGKYCGSRPLTYFVSSSNMVYIKFYTDGSVGGRGFNISYRQVDALCGGVRTAMTSPQTISSPNYPNSYPHNLRCRWTIDAGLNQQIDVNVTDFNVENHANCQYDYLELRDKPLGDNGQILMYCGSQLPPLFTSKGRTMQINFVTDASATAPGFSLTYQVASCNRTHSGSTGRVTSPGWPGRYPSYSRCYVVIQSPPGTYLSLYFNSFYIEPHTSCNFDYLEIRNGSDASAGLVGKYCGNTLPDPVFATGNSIWMFFLTDNSVTHPGYDITFASSSSAPGCGGTFKDSYGSFTSPLYPQPYTNNRNCTWLVQVPARKVVTITFTAFNIEYHDSCNYDWVDVYDGPSTSSTRVGRYCGDSMPAEFTASGRAVTIFFRSDQSQTGPGFRIAYSSSQPALMQSADKSSIG